MTAPLPAEGETERPSELPVGDPPSAYPHRTVGLTPAEAASAAAGEVRVEWGVRFGWEFDVQVDNLFEKAVAGSRGGLDERSAVALADELRAHPKFRDVRLRRRTITTYPDGSFLTSPWVPVSALPE